MITLNTTSKKLEGVLGGAITTTQLKCVVVYIDETSIDAKKTRTTPEIISFNNTTPVTLCSAPTSDNTSRNILSLWINNVDSVNATVTIQYDVSGTDTIIITQTLAPGETLFYEDGSGWGII